MGNHEWCEHCETSDFHYGYPCDPERLRVIKERKDAYKIQADKAKIELAKLTRSLEKKKIKCTHNEHGDLVIEWYQFMRSK